MATTVTTSTSSVATRGGRMVATTSDGTIWTCLYDGANSRWTFWYSDDDGSSFSENTNLRTASSSSTVKAAIAISDNDWLWFAAANSTSLGKLSYTTSAVTSTSSWDQTPNLQFADYGSIDLCVVKKSGSPTYYTACVVGERTNVNHLYLEQARVESTGGAPTQSPKVLDQTITAAKQQVTIDWTHTGDGKTPSGTPSLFVAYNNAGTVGNVLVKLSENLTPGVYNSASSVRTLASNAAQSNDALTGVCDGSRFVVAFIDDSSDLLPQVYQRDYADTTTTELPTSGSIPALSDGAITSLSLGVADDGTSGDFRLYAVGTTSDDVKYTEYDRSADTFSAWTTIGTTTATNLSLSVQRGSYNYGLSLLWTSGSGSPYDIVWEVDQTNIAPLAPTWESPANGSAADAGSTLALDWAFNDSPGDTQSAYALKRTISAAVTYYRASDSTWQASEIKNTSTTSGVTLPTTWAADGETASFECKTWDALDVEGVYGDALEVLGSTPVTPVLTAPTDSSTVTGPTPTITWTATEQTAYRLRWLTSGDVELYDSGKVVSTTKSLTSPYSLANGLVGAKVEVRVWNDDDLEGSTDTHSVDVTFTEPATPTYVVSAVPASGYISVAITDPTPTGSEPDVTSHDVYVRVASGGRQVGERTVNDDGIRIATGVAENGTYLDYAAPSGVDLEYRTRAIADNGTSTYGAWT